ncbi:MAG: hypothetical protein ACO3N7_04710 [Kiritimatiellia bacterium]
MDPHSDLLDEAETIAALGRELGLEFIVVGALALAAHHYVRSTGDVDLAGVVSLDKLHDFKDRLQQSGYDVELRLPDADDPLGGVLDIHHEEGLIQLISFADRFPGVIRDALQEAKLTLSERGTLPIVPLAHLVVLKLYAGGLKSKADVVEVLSRNPDADLNAIEALCEGYRIRGFEEIRRELRA